MGSFMLKARGIIITGMVTAALLVIYKPLCAEYPFLTPAHNLNTPPFEYANAGLWQYLRLGLNYLESPKPLAPPETVSPSYVHPDAKGFGAYGFSPQAYQDVQRIYSFFKQYSWQDIMGSQKLYDLANQAFTDWLLRNLRDYIPKGATQKEIFDILHRAWNLGLTGFKSGKGVVLSRTKRAEEFMVSPLPLARRPFLLISS